MTTHDRDKVIAIAEQVKANNDMFGDFSVALYAIAFEDGRQSVDTPVALAEAYRCGEDAGRQAEQERCAKIAWNYEPNENGPIETAIRARGDTK